LWQDYFADFTQQARTEAERSPDYTLRER
jgi:hypothetical protein